MLNKVTYSVIYLFVFSQQAIANKPDHCVSIELSNNLIATQSLDAVKILQDYSARGCNEASYKLGILFSTKGSEFYNLNKATKWFARSSIDGHPLAQANLGLRYLKGIGVKKDKALGYSLLEMSAKQGLIKSKKIIIALLPQMSDEEIDRSKKIDPVHVISNQLNIDDGVSYSSITKNVPQNNQDVVRDKKPTNTISSIYMKSIPYIYMILADSDVEYQHQGSGFLLSGGLVITNEHVVESNNRVIGINQDEDQFSMTVIYSNKEHDLAVLKPDKHIEGGLNLSMNKLTVGSDILVIGSPSSLTGTITEGIISSYRNINDIDYMQVSAAVNPGNSGGPVLGMDGSVYGLVTYKHTEADSVGFALTSGELFQQMRNLSVNSQKSIR